MVPSRMEQAPEPFICVERHGLEHPPSPHHEFVAVLGVGPELLKSSFSTFNVKPTSASEATSSSNKRHALSNVVQNTNMSAANGGSNKGLRPS